MNTSKHVLIECYACKSKVSATILATREYGGTHGELPYIYYFLECSVCHESMVGCSILIQVAPSGWEYDEPARLWPNPKKRFDLSIPVPVRRSLEEARKCLDAQAYSASAVMCGRAIEAVCKEHGTKKWELYKGLKELNDKGVIDGRLLEWGEGLRDRRNIGAHATDEEVSREDASDVLDFAAAICEYVYVLTAKYEAFKKRELENRS